MTPEEVQELRRQRYNATIVRLRHANPDLVTVLIRPDFHLPVHKPGQYTSLGLGLTVALPINRRQSLKLYYSSGVVTRTGTDFDTIGGAWQYRWGAGL